MRLDFTHRVSLFFAVVLLGIATTANAQTSARVLRTGVGAPSGNCRIFPSGYGDIYINLVNGAWYTCKNSAGLPTSNGTWTLQTGGGGGGGDVTGPSAAADGELVLFSGSTGKVVRRSSALTGYVKLASGVVSAAPIPASDLPTAAADGTTKGVASFNAADFDASSGNVSLDYTNGQAANGSTKGFLTAADWTTFNSKQAGPLTGDVVTSGAAATIANNAVTNAKMADVATATFKGRTSAGTGDPEDLTATQATALLNAMVGDSGSGGTKGLVPAPAAGDTAANKFLKANGTWAAPSGAGDTVGPASSTDNAIARFDGTTGKLLQNSAVTIDDSNNLSTPGSISTGVGGSVAGNIALGQGTATSVAASTVQFQAPTSVTGYNLVFPGATGNGFLNWSNSANVATATFKAAPSGTVVGDTDTQTLTHKTLTNPAITVQTLTDAATISWNADSGNMATVTLGGNRTMAAPTNLKAGGSYSLTVTQDGTGSRTITWNSVFKWASGTAPTLTTTASRTDLITCISNDGTNLLCNALLDIR